jgi:hypothetical protein
LPFERGNVKANGVVSPTESLSEVFDGPATLAEKREQTLARRVGLLQRFRTSWHCGHLP